MSSQDQYLSVSKFNRKMKMFFKNNSNFSNVYVKGEVSGVKISPSGHLYFNLKDNRSVVPCVIFKSIRRNIEFKIKNGMKLLVIADVDVYVPHGKYQLNVREVSEDGLGKLYVKYQQLKEKLTEEGLFSHEFKKTLPDFPKRIGVVTSKSGSVIHDILKTVKNLWPYCEIIIFPSPVQGQTATNKLITQINNADSFNLDVIIIARGGGSIEDLWCFNEESLVRSIFKCETPVISAIGHETDITLCDLVSDKRASNPTMAATIAINNREKIIEQVNGLNKRLLSYMSSKVDEYKSQYEYMLSRQLFSDSTYVYKSKKVDFDNLFNRFEYNSTKLLNSNKNMLNKIKSEYVIRHPCKMQLDFSKHELNKLQNRLIDAVDLIIKDKQHNLDKTTEEFRFNSDKFVSNQKFKLNQIKTSYVIQNPCKIQTDYMNSNLKISYDNLVKSIDYKLNSNQKDFENIINKNLFKNPSIIYMNKSLNLDKLKEKFINQSRKLIITNFYKVDTIKNKSVIQSPHLIYQSKYNDLDKLKNKFLNISNEVILANSHRLNLIRNNSIIQNPHLIYQSKYEDLDKLKNKFINNSNEVILSNFHKLDLIKNESVIKNPNLIYKIKYEDLYNLKDKDIIRNPYLMLDENKRKLEANKEKLDKINQVITLKKEQEKQKAKYIKIIAVIVIILIILIILFIGGI